MLEPVNPHTTAFALRRDLLGPGIASKKRRQALAVSIMRFAALAAILLVPGGRDGTVVVRVGDWAPELGIAIVADRFAAIVLMGPTSLDYTSLNLGRTRILRTAFPCQPCQLKVCPIDHRCMTQLRPEGVLQEALAALGDPSWSGDAALEGPA